MNERKKLFPTLGGKKMPVGWQKQQADHLDNDPLNLLVLKRNQGNGEWEKVPPKNHGWARRGISGKTLAQYLLILNNSHFEISMLGAEGEVLEVKFLPSQYESIEPAPGHISGSTEAPISPFSRGYLPVQDLRFRSLLLLIGRFIKQDLLSEGGAQMLYLQGIVPIENTKKNRGGGRSLTTRRNPDESHDEASKTGRTMGNLCDKVRNWERISEEAFYCGNKQQVKATLQMNGEIRRIRTNNLSFMSVGPIWDQGKVKLILTFTGLACETLFEQGE